MSTWMACIFSGHDPWTRKSAVLLASYKESAKPLSAIKDLYLMDVPPCYDTENKTEYELATDKLHGRKGHPSVNKPLSLLISG